MPYVLIKDPMYINFWKKFQALRIFSSLIVFVLQHKFAHFVQQDFFITVTQQKSSFHQSRSYIYSFCQIFQALHLCTYSFCQSFYALCLFKALRLSFFQIFQALRLLWSLEDTNSRFLIYKFIIHKSQIHNLQIQKVSGIHPPENQVQRSGLNFKNNYRGVLEKKALCVYI